MKRLRGGGGPVLIPHEGRDGAEEDYDADNRDDGDEEQRGYPAAAAERHHYRPTLFVRDHDRP